MDKYIDLLSESSHEIRTPLNSLTGMLELLQEREDLKDDLYLSQAIASAEQLRLMINELLDLARLEKGNLKLKMETMSMNELQDYILTTFLPMCQKKDISFTCDNTMFDVEYVQGDEYRTKQALRHIFTNAILYTEPGGSIHYYMNAEKDDNKNICFVFHITDTGSGMSPEFLSRIGDPLVNNDLEHFHSGLGIGLAITKRLVDLANGTLTIESQPGKGTTVHVRTPLAKASRRRDIRMIVGKGLDYEKATYPNLTALIVEDHPVNQKIICRLLESLGLHTILANDGKEALEEFQNSEPESIHIIFMDLRMPNMNGIEASRQIRRLVRKDARSIPIVAMTASEKEEDGNKAILAGMNYYMVKPCNKKEIQKVLAIEFLNS